nr:immunoglobulin heavy chain junction region [Mus musculus]MBK4185490.1 immunoglobulin heavy chain junction region [Mus musculus]MBK4185494.1 immunoglobulin heavy chain junction region [Mus musculus]
CERGGYYGSTYYAMDFW